jgi:hypothetical protein
LSSRADAATVGPSAQGWRYAPEGCKRAKKDSKTPDTETDQQT